MKKGFTLIELLAVIVILAIIAVIAVPIVLDIIKDTKDSALLRSADFYIDAVENEIMLENMKQGGNFNPNTCEVKNSKLICDGKELTIKVDGEVPSSGSITFENGKVTNVNLTYQGGNITLNNKGELVLDQLSKEEKVCQITDDENNDGIADVGDKITCSTESFRVISNDGETISMLAVYNLEVGYYAGDLYEEYCESCEIAGDCLVNIEDVCEKVLIAGEQAGSISNPSGIQNSRATGYEEKNWVKIDSFYYYNLVYGVERFSTPKYWYDNEYIVDVNYANEGREYPFVYGDYKDADGNQQNRIYPYVKAYEKYLIKNGVISATATLISYEQFTDLKNNKGNPGWLYTTTYWTGSADVSGIWGVYSDGIDVYSGYGDPNYYEYYYEGKGVRPVVNISISEL